MCTIYDETNKLWMNSSYQLLSPDHKITVNLLKLLSMYGSKVAQMNDDNGAEMTYHELWLNTIRVAQNLQKRGYQPHQVFGFMADNTDHLVSIVLASFCLACPIAPLHPLMSTAELVRIWSKTKPSVIFCDHSAYNQMNEALKDLNFNVKVFILGQSIDGLETVESLLTVTGYESDFVPIHYDAENDIAGIFCSSGTTEPSKSVCISFAHRMFQPEIYDENSILLSFRTIYWTSGLEQILDSIHNGATRIITTKPYAPELQLTLIEKYRVSILHESPSTLLPCLKSDAIHHKDLSSVQIIFLYGSKVPCNLVREIIPFFPNANCVSYYGLKEFGRITVSIHGVQESTNGTHLVDGYLTKIVDNEGDSCGPNASGELCVKKKCKFLGYFNDPVANAAALDSDGFFHTGDVGRFDEDGIFFIEGRKKNILDYLISMPDINEVRAVGVPIEDGTNENLSEILDEFGKLI